jgi:hypothetical protein
MKHLFQNKEQKSGRKWFFNLFLKGQFLFLFFLSSFFVFGQSSLNRLTFIHNSSLKEQVRTVSERGNAITPSTHSSSFQAIAFPANNLSNEIISLDYINKQLIVKIGKRTIYPDLPDWQLVPIARFANSSYQSVFSPFGNINNGEAPYLFHQAFLDNLLGLRLFQANLLNRPDVLWDIPKNENGDYILAKSEGNFIPYKSQSIYEAINKGLQSTPNNFTSYLLTDRNVEIIFSIEADQLKFSGHPYYYFIKTKAEPAKATEFSKEIETCYKDIEEAAQVYLKEKYTPELNPRTNLKGLLKVLEENKKNELFDPYSIYYIKKAITKLNELNHLPDEDIKGNSQTLDDFSASFNKRNWDLLKQYNPLVYSAVENTSHWAAFFRYIRLTNPSNWVLFLKKVENTSNISAPVVKTPIFIK